MTPVSYQISNLNSFIGFLPRSIVLEIFKLLTRHDLLSVSRVCRLSRAIAMDPSLFPLIEFRLFNSLPSGIIIPTVIPFYKVCLGSTPETECLFGKELTRVFLGSAGSHKAVALSVARAYVEFTARESDTHNAVTLGEVRTYFELTEREFIYVDVNYNCIHAKVEQDNATLTSTSLFSLFSVSEIQHLNLDPSKFYINFWKAKRFIYIKFSPKLSFIRNEDINNVGKKTYILIYEVDCQKPPSCFFENLCHHITYTELNSRVISIERIKQNSSTHLMIDEDLHFKEVNESYLVLSQRETEENFCHFFYDLNTLQCQARARVSHLLPDLEVNGIYCLFHQELFQRKKTYQEELVSSLKKLKNSNKKSYLRDLEEENRHSYFDNSDDDSIDFYLDRVQEPEVYQPQIVAKTRLANIRTLQYIPLTPKTKDFFSTFDHINDIRILKLEEKDKMRITIEGKRHEEKITIELTIDVTIPLTQ